MNNKGMFMNIFCGVLCILALLFVMCTIIGDAIKEEVEVVDGLCYDRYGNEIQEMVCDHSIYDYKWFSWLYGSIEKQKEYVEGLK